MESGCGKIPDDGVPLRRTGEMTVPEIAQGLVEPVWSSGAASRLPTICITAVLYTMNQDGLVISIDLIDDPILTSAA